MSDIFISYKREEQPEARKLADALQKKGWSVWWDPKLRAGEHFDDAIERALNDAKCVIVMWSKLSVKSRYVKDEATYALNSNKLMPIAIEEVDLPLRFAGIQTGQLIDWDGTDNYPEYQKLVTDIVSILGEPPIQIEERRWKEEAKRKADKELKRKDAAVEGKRNTVDERENKEAKTKLVDKRPPITSPKSPRQKKLTLGIVAIAVIVVFSVIGWLLLFKSKYAKTFKNMIGMEFVLISAGSFQMGSPREEPGRFDSEKQHEVTISKPFYLQTTEVTQGQWKSVMGDNPSRFKECGDNCPVEQVSWDDAQRFIIRLNGMEGNNPFKYRLPTEAEWEYAVRAGTKTVFSFGDNPTKLGEYAWNSGNSEGKTHPVGQKKPNAWGLYDMHGNVWEWVADDWHDSYDGAPDDGRAWIDDPRGTNRVKRGCGLTYDTRSCRSANRSYQTSLHRNPDVGFRLARSVAIGP